MDLSPLAILVLLGFALLITFCLTLWTAFGTVRKVEAAPARGRRTRRIRKAPKEPSQAAAPARQPERPAVQAGLFDSFESVKQQRREDRVVQPRRVNLQEFEVAPLSEPAGRAKARANAAERASSPRRDESRDEEQRKAGSKEEGQDAFSRFLTSRDDF